MWIKIRTILIFLCINSSLCEGQNTVKDPFTEKNRTEGQDQNRKLIDELSNSKEPEERILAAKHLLSRIYKQSYFDTLQKLLNDPDCMVRLHNFRAIKAQATKRCLSKEEAVFFQKYIERKEVLSKDLYTPNAFKENNDLAIFLEMACALNSLYFNYQIISPSNFEHWQNNRYFEIINYSITSFNSEIVRESSLHAFSSFWHPRGLLLLVPRLLETSIKSENTVALGIICSVNRHPIVGVKEPMHLVFEKQIKKSIQEIKGNKPK